MSKKSDQDYEYPDFEDWFNELENYGMRSERFLDSLGQFQSDSAYRRNLIIWLEAAFRCGRAVKGEAINVYL